MHDDVSNHSRFITSKNLHSITHTHTHTLASTLLKLTHAHEQILSLILKFSSSLTYGQCNDYYTWSDRVLETENLQEAREHLLCTPIAVRKRKNERGTVSLGTATSFPQKPLCSRGYVAQVCACVCVRVCACVCVCVRVCVNVCGCL